MLHKTNGIVLRSVKYGESSLVTTIFTQLYGVQAYMVQGVRSAKSRQNRAAFFQPGTMLALVVYHQPNKNLQRLREFQAQYIYGSVQEDVTKNSIVLFSVEILLRLLPEHAAMPELYDFVYGYLVALDKMPTGAVANFPLYFITHCSREFGFDLKGSYSNETPFLNLAEGGFTAQAPAAITVTTDEDARALSSLLKINKLEEAQQVSMNGDMRLRLLDWYVIFLQQHTQHMGNVRSLSILRTVLH
ncbi:MAG: recO [Flavipsychrobacter sp.]|jgi:DNA repair protein RecO (recombination protein O)|nr:recO [Flavipsychrobacter sp.]